MTRTATLASATTDLTRAAPPALQRACACGAAKGVEDQCPNCSAQVRLGVQPKLTLNRPGDRYEQEADRIADRVVSAGPPGPVAPSAPTLQREMAEEEDELQAKPAGVQRMEEEEDEDQLQRKPAGLQRMEDEEDELRMKPAGPAPASPAVSRAATAVSEGGQPLSRAERSYFEPRLGRDLSAVRLHDNARAGSAARGINARAYTLKNHIAFAPGTRDFASTEGRRLMAHELVHTVQQSGAVEKGGPRIATMPGGSKALQRDVQPKPRNRAVCPRPPSARKMGIAAHSAIQTRFKKSGKGRISELTIPFLDTSVCKAADSDRYEPKTSRGRVDLAIVKQTATKVKISLGEIKPYNGRGVSAAAGVIGCYERGIKTNSDVCLQGPEAMKGTVDAVAIPFCTRLGAFGKKLEVGPTITWQTAPVTVDGRLVTVVNMGGLFFYTCAEAPDGKKKKQKKSREERRERRKKRKEKQQSKRARKKAARQAKRAERQAAKSAKNTATSATKKAATSQAAKRGTGPLLRRGGRVVGSAVKKAAPYIEVAVFAAALLGGAKPTFAGDGVSAEEALLEMAQNGTPPDVKMSEKLRKFLDENPEAMEVLEEVAKGQQTTDEGAQAMIDLLEANMDQMDSETLEKLAKFMAESGEPEMQQTAEEFRKTLELIKKGARPGDESADGAEEPGSGLPAPEEDAARGKETGEEEGSETEAAVIPDKLREKYNKSKPLRDLINGVFDRTKSKKFTEPEIALIQSAIDGLEEDNIAKLAEFVAQLPTIDSDSPDAKQKMLDLVVELAEKLKAGQKVPPPQSAEGGSPASPTKAPTGTSKPDDSAPKTPSSGDLTQVELEWAKKGIRYRRSKAGGKARSAMKFAYERDEFVAKLAEIDAARTKESSPSPTSGSLFGGIGFLTDDGKEVGTFGRADVYEIDGQTIKMRLSSQKQFVFLKGHVVEEKVSLPTDEIVRKRISKKIYKFGSASKKDGKP